MIELAIVGDLSGHFYRSHAYLRAAGGLGVDAGFFNAHDLVAVAPRLSPRTRFLVHDEASFAVLRTESEALAHLRGLRTLTRAASVLAGKHAFRSSLSAEHSVPHALLGSEPELRAFAESPPFAPSWVLKPRRGSFSRQVRRACSARELAVAVSSIRPR